MPDMINGMQWHDTGVYSVVEGVTSLAFTLDKVKSGMSGDIAMIRVDNMQGDIGRYKSSDTGYANAIFREGRWTSLLAGYQGVGTHLDNLAVDPNGYYMFGMINGSDFEASKDNREYGRLLLSNDNKSSYHETDANGMQIVGWNVYSFEDLVLNVRKAETEISAGEFCQAWVKASIGKLRKIMILTLKLLVVIMTPYKILVCFW